MCLFQIGWSVFGCYVTTRAFSSVSWMANDAFVYLLSFLIASIILDILISGSEFVHKYYHEKLTREQKELELQRSQDAKTTVEAP